MMEKDLNKDQLDKLICDWTEESLPTDIDDQISDRIWNFIAADDDKTEPDVYELLDFHIHDLAMKENMTKRRKWKIIFSSVAAASVVLFMVAAIIFSIRVQDPHNDYKTLVAENKETDKPTVSNSRIHEIVADSSNLITAKAVIKEKPEAASVVGNKRNHSEKAINEKEDTSELVLTETIAEINAGFANMADTANECLYMTNTSLHPVIFFSGNIDSDNFESIPDEYSSSQSYGDIQKLNIIETNLVNVLYEIRSLNIDLNLETDYKKTEL